MPGRASVVAWLLVAALASGAAAARRPALRGVVEGYYGRPWTGAARRDVIRFLGQHGLNAFVYAPKNDAFHRARWREPYPAEALADLHATAATARRAHVQLVYGLSPVLDVCYACPRDFHALTAKLTQVARAGLRRFALLFDDGGALTAPEDVARYGGSDAAALARAQADLVNRTHAWLGAHRHRRLVLMVPSDYAGTECHPYHAALDAALARAIPVAWTGPGVFADTITEAEARVRRGCLPQHALVLWDNYPVNDTLLSNNLHLGPLTGRDPALARVLHGYLLNPMTEAHASLVALGTAAAYLRDPRRYAPERAWAETLDELSGGGTGLAILAAQVRSSALDLRDAVALADAVDTVAASFSGADWTSGVGALGAELAAEAAAPADIAARLGGTPLGDEIAPWVHELAVHATRGMVAVTLFAALKPALTDVRATADGPTLHVAGRAVGPDFDTAARLGPDFAAEAAAVAARIARPPFGAFFACLGDILGADIRFCPEFGLNVHGKMLYVVIRTVSDIEFVSDRNIYERLVMLAGSTYAEWSARQGPGSGALTVTADGTPLALAADGAFAATIPAPSGHVTLVVRTAAGDATARSVP
jgi:hyaluronoglucosaminidase